MYGRYKDSLKLTFPRDFFLGVSLTGSNAIFLAGKTTDAVFTLERFTEVLEFTYLGKYFACVNAS